MRSRLALAAAALLAAPLLAAVPAAAGPAQGSAVSPSALAATRVTGFPLTAATITKGRTWAITVKVTGPVGRAVILQRRAGAGVVVVAVGKTAKGGVVKFSVKAPKAGQYRIAVPKKGTFKATTTGWRTLKVVSPPAPPTWPTALSGPFSGTYRLSGWVFTWSGQATFQYQERDPYTNTVYQDAVHYTLIGGSYTWNVATDAAHPTDCTYTGSGSVTIDENGTTTSGSAQIEFDRDAKDPSLGWNWQAAAFAVKPASGKLLPVTKTCFGNAEIVDFGDNAGNTGAGGAFIQTNYFHKDYTTDKKTFARIIDLTSPAIPGYLQHWDVSLTGTGAVTPPYWRPCSDTVITMCHW